MEKLFLDAFNLSLAASRLILAVILIRFCLKKAPRRILCLLWAAVALRLICPFSIESAFSLAPRAKTLDAYNMQYETPQIHSSFAVINEAVNPLLEEHFSPADPEKDNPLYAVMRTLSVFWLIGAAVMLIYAALSYLRVYRSVRESTPIKERIYLCDQVKSPFILGIFSPKIFLPSDADAAFTDAVIAHEKAHIARGDHVWKPLGYLLLSFYWFSPLCWLAYMLLCRDIELACDEKVIARMDLAEKKEYSAALLECSRQRRLITVCPLAFGEVGVKERVKSILRYKKPAFWLIALSSAVCIVTVCCFMTSPVKASKPQQSGTQAEAPQQPGTGSQEPGVDSGAGAEQGAQPQDPGGQSGASQNFGAGAESEPEQQDALEAAVSKAIMEKNEWRYMKGTFACESHAIYASEGCGPAAGSMVEEVTLYMMVLYREYIQRYGNMEVTGGGIHAAILTFRKEADGSYAITEYWEPQPGEEISEEKGGRIPQPVVDAMREDGKSVAASMYRECDEQAQEHYAKLHEKAAAAGAE